MFKSILLALSLVVLVSVTNSFVPISQRQQQRGFQPRPFEIIYPSSSTTATTGASFLFPNNNKKNNEQEDLSYIETRDMTRDEMKRYNESSERIMNQELWGMTIFSLILSLPMFYLVWVGFFAETAEFGL